MSSGVNEGFAHPRPELVAASATTGYREVVRKLDRLVTPLIYMTEIERSTSVGAITRIRFNKYPIWNGLTEDGALFSLPFSDISEGALPTQEDS